MGTVLLPFFFNRSIQNCYFAFSLELKSVKDVATALKKWFFPVISLSSIVIMHSDNGLDLSMR